MNFNHTSAWLRLGTACAANLLLLMLAAPVQGQFQYSTINGTITITGYTGPGGAEIIPATIDGLPVISIGSLAFHLNTSLTSITIPNTVTSIGIGAFADCASLTNITIPHSVTNIGVGAFYRNTSLTTVTIPNGVTSIGYGVFSYCTSLTSVTLPNSVTSIGDSALWHCTSLTSVTIPNSVTSIAAGMFYTCESLTSVTIPNSVTNIGDAAFAACSSLTAVYFQGNAPTASSNMFAGADGVTIYYLPSTTGWGTTFASRPTVLWNPLINTADASFAVRTNRFGFTITGASDLVLVVEACTNLANPIWSTVGTNTLTGGSSYFSDPEWTNHPGRFYRLRAP